MSPDKYTTYSTKDFLADDDFIQWVSAATPEQDIFWNSFTTQYPGKASAVHEAAATIRAYREQDVFLNEEHKEALWHNIQEGIRQQPVYQRKTIRMSVPAFLRIAAAVFVLAGLAAWALVYFHQPTDYSYSTAFGQIKTVVLPDESTVTLNGNSTLSYSSWQKGHPREVRIKGEAYFNVTHLNTDSTHITADQRFIVHCDNVNIEVLGTTFNVKSRRGQTNVALITGKIRVDYTNGNAPSQTLVMTPGDYAVYKANTLVSSKKLSRPVQVSTWTVSEIAFTDASLKEITETLQDNYGYTVELSDSSLQGLKIEGDISVTSVADLFDVMSSSLGIKITEPTPRHLVISR